MRSLFGVAKTTGRRRGAEGDSRKQREEEKNQKKKNTRRAYALLSARNDDFGRTNFTAAPSPGRLSDRER
jgi:hypothetical protein